MRMLLIAAALIISGCQTYQPPATASGKIKMNYAAPASDVKRSS